MQHTHQLFHAASHIKDDSLLPSKIVSTHLTHPNVCVWARGMQTARHPLIRHSNLCMSAKATECARACLDGYCSTVQDLLDWFEVDLGFTELYLFR